MHKNKYLAIVLTLGLLFALAIPAFAETTDEWMSEVAGTVENYTGDVTVVYTADSAISQGVYVEPEIDILSKQILLCINADLPLGYVIYDVPDTPYVDGVRVNGNTVTSLKVPVDYTQDANYEIVVKVAYAEDFTGTLAQISDGTFNWATLLENPVTLLIVVYYALAIISVIIAIFAAWKGKDKRVKSAEEISKAVQDTADATATKVIEEKVLPIAVAFQNTAQSLVKAFTLTTSKSKEAPIALLDILQEVANTDVTATIEQAKAAIATNRADADRIQQATLAKLNSIANTIQEVTSNETPKQEADKQSEDLPIF